MDDFIYFTRGAVSVGFLVVVVVVVAAVVPHLYKIVP